MWRVYMPFGNVMMEKPWVPCFSPWLDFFWSSDIHSDVRRTLPVLFHTSGLVWDILKEGVHSSISSCQPGEGWGPFPFVRACRQFPLYSTCWLFAATRHVSLPFSFGSRCRCVTSVCLDFFTHAVIKNKISPINLFTCMKISEYWGQI